MGTPEPSSPGHGSWKDRLEILAGSGLGSGFGPGMPGTWGTLPPLFMTLALMQTGAWHRTVALALATLAGTATVSLGTRAERRTGGKDPAWFVLDEWSGYFATLAVVPAASWRAALAGFLLFRLADIIKPFPARWLESLRGGWGILADDLAAAAWAGAGLWLVGRWLTW